MEAPGRLAATEDAMPSTFRTTTAVVVLALLLGLCTVPAHAQPRGAQAGGSRAEMKVLEQVWHWLNDLWAHPGVREQVQKGGPTLVTDRSAADLASLNRGGAYDPNGHS